MTTQSFPVKRPGFGAVLASEWTKIKTVKSTYWTVLATVIVTVGLSFLLALAITANLDSMDAGERAQFDATSWGMLGINFGILILAVLGVMVITSEYSTGMIRTSLTAVPSRGKFFLGKALALAGVSFVVGQIAAFLSFFIGQSVFSGKNLSVSIGDEGVLRAVFGAGLYLMLIALFAFAVGALLRHTAGAITLVLGVLFVLPIIANFVPDGWGGETLRKYLPTNAGTAITSVRPADGFLTLWAAFGVFVLYTAILMVAAYLLFQRRDA